MGLTFPNTLLNKEFHFSHLMPDDFFINLPKSVKINYTRVPRTRQRKSLNLPDKFVVELVITARGRQKGVAVGDKKVENDGGLKSKWFSLKSCIDCGLPLVYRNM